MPTIERSIIVNASAAYAFEILADVESYPQFVPRITKANILLRKTLALRVEFGMSIIQPIEYVVDLKLTSPQRITWKLVKGDYMKSNEGSWTIVQKGKNKVELIYDMSLEFDVWIPSVILNPILESTFPAMLEAFKKRMEGGVKGRAA